MFESYSNPWAKAYYSFYLEWNCVNSASVILIITDDCVVPVRVTKYCDERVCLSVSDHV